MQSPDFAGAGVGSVQLLLSLPQSCQAALLCLWFFRFGFRPAIKTGNAGFDFFQQLVVGGDLPVDFSLVGADTALLHLAGRWPQVDRGDFINSLSLVAAVVYQGGMTGGLQCPVGAGRPCRPPNLHIPFVVPVGGVLPVVLPAAFPVRDTLSILVQVVCLAALCAPCAIFFQGPDGQHDMNMGVAGSLVMDSKVGAHSFAYKVVLHIGTHKGKLLFAGQFTGQGCFNLAGKLAVPCFLDLLHAVPEDRTVCKFRRGVGRQHDLRMDNAAFPGVVVGHSIPFICQLGSAAVSSCGNSRTACAALDNTDGDMTKIYGWHLLSAGIFQAPWSRTNAKRVFGCAGRTRGLGSVAPHRGRSTQQPPAGRTTPATVYKCALVNKGLMACPRILAGLQSIPQPPEDGTGQSEML